jgi:hypothetical protein
MVTLGSAVIDRQLLTRRGGVDDVAEFGKRLAAQGVRVQGAHGRCLL